MSEGVSLPIITPDMRSSSISGTLEPEENFTARSQATSSSVPAEVEEENPLTMVGTPGDEDPLGGEESKVQDPTLAVLDNLLQYTDDLEPTVFNDDIKQPSENATAQERQQLAMRTKVGSISPRSIIESKQTDEERNEVLEKDRYLKKHPELVDLAQLMYLNALRDKPDKTAEWTKHDPDPIINYFSRVFFGPDHVPELENLRKESKERAKYG